MSTTQIPPPPETQPTDLYDSQGWQVAYRDLHATPTILIQLQDDLSRSRKREAFWISVAVHLLVILFVVNSPRFSKLFPKATVLVNPSHRDQNLTYLELPPDVQKITKRPQTNKLSDRDRIAQSKTPQIDPRELQKIIEAARAGRKGSRGEPAAPKPQAQQPAPQPNPTPAPQTPPPPPKVDSNQTAKLQTPPMPKPSFNTAPMSVGSSIAEAAREAASNRGGYAGDSGDMGVGGRQPTARMGPLDVLSDTMGVDFGPYLQRVLHDVRMNWYNLIPEVARAPLMKKGKLSIEFAILKDGRVAGMQLVSGSGDVALDRGAWGGITASNPFPPLPTEFQGQYLKLRFTFFYNPDKSDLQ